MSSNPPDQRECTARLLEVTPDALVVSNLGVASYVLADVADRPRNFYLWGSMGVTTPVGLGLAMAADEPVTVLDGDGSLLMALGHLATVATVNPPNLTIVVFDNASYLTTGGQPTPTDTLEFAAIAKECGLHATTIDSASAFEAAYRDAQARDEASLIACPVAPIETEARPPMDFTHIKHRIRHELAG